MFSLSPEVRPSYLSPWHSHLHYVPPQPSPPPVAHKVYILDCATCNIFLTNRGMKAVLLYGCGQGPSYLAPYSCLCRPSVALYSSDSLPVNCSVYTSNPHALRPACSAAPTNRSCECLTQLLACHSCGASVGYMIVLPCARCTSSITTANRSTNGHRFVFHSGEIQSTERHYILDEPGVIVSRQSPAASHTLYYRPPAFSHHSHALAAASRPEYLAMPPLDSEDMSTSAASDPTSPSAASFPFAHDNAHVGADYPIHPRPTSPTLSDSSTSSLPPLIQPSPPFGLPAERVEASFIPLAAGDVLYWHHLRKHGEIPGVIEDRRARRRSWAMKSGIKVQFDR
ncbi:hypothetical protein C8F01DRAFT_1103042 [Mycena amicta]|nr:hypothetical protein C8F01DRAFT_1103042 [Mycena amicta]